MVGLLAACASQAPSPSPVSGPDGKPEKTTIVIGDMQIPDSAAAHLADKHEFFAAEGLQVKFQVVQGAGPAIPQLKSGMLDISLLNYVTTFLAQAAGQDLRFVADGYQAVPGTFALMVAKNSPIKTPADLRGKKIAVATRKSIGTLTVEATLRTYGLSADDVEIVEFPLPDMPGKLAQGVVDAAWMTQPFILQAGTTSGAVQIADVMSGEMADFPIAGYGVSAQFARDNPRTVAAFQRALSRGQAMAADNPQAVKDILPGYTKIPQNIADVIPLGVYPQTMEKNRLQRVADQMLAYRMLTRKLDVAPLLLPMPQMSLAPTPLRGIS
ncbi:ABC transporter substrate-binding protein [Streptosporangium canum]|uniref:ABC transporter substrate-binding protein n=1 Tax=Streptosporangium canum TaxID=324952 RepID=UPI0037B30C9B